MKKHRWQNSDTCADCGLRREGAGAGPYGAMRYYWEGGQTYMYKPGACAPRKITFKVIEVQPSGAAVIRTPLVSL